MNRLHIRRVRKMRNMTQVQLAMKSGIDPTTIARLDRDEGNPSLQTLERIAEALKVDVHDLISRRHKAVRQKFPALR